jgi:hypothetical protein
MIMEALKSLKKHVTLVAHVERGEVWGEARMDS